MYALIQKTDNKILDFSKINYNLAEEKPFYWLLCPDSCDFTWKFNGTNFIPPAAPKLTKEEILQNLMDEFTAAIQSVLDTKAVEKGYDNIVSACSYAAAPNPFQEESIKFVTWRGNVWAYCYQELAKVKAGTRPTPKLEDFLLELPTISFV